MQGSFTSHTYNVSALLGRTSFPNYTAKKVVVPPFQRGYSWEKSHVAAFWDDLFTFHRRKNSDGVQDTYFFGPTVILPQDDFINLLDGQQRLATMTILLCVIRDLARAKGGPKGSDLARDIQRDLIMVDDEEDVYALNLSELDDPYFRSNVQEDPPNGAVKATLRSHRLIRQAKSYLNGKVGEIVAGSNAKELVAKLRSLRKTVDAHLKLVTIEVQSEDEAFLIFETLNDRGLRLAVPDLLLNHLMRTAENDAQRKRVRQSWNTVVENLGQRKVSTFIRHMWVSRYGDVKSQGLFREIRGNLTEQGIPSVDFAELCAKESEDYVAITGLDKGRLGPGALPHVEGLVKYLSDDRALPLLLSGLASLGTGEFEKLARSAVSLIVRHSVLANLNPSNLEDTLYSAARVLRAEKDNGASSAKCLYSAKTVLSKLDPTEEQVKTNIVDVYLTRNQALYMTYALATKMQSASNALTIASNSLEHIYPENADKMEWPERDELEPLAWHFGNLTVLEPKYNQQAANLSYDTKKGIYPKSVIAMTNEIPTKYNQWGQTEIFQRARNLLPIATQVWSVA